MHFHNPHKPCFQNSWVVFVKFSRVKVAITPLVYGFKGVLRRHLYQDGGYMGMADRCTVTAGDQLGGKSLVKPFRFLDALGWLRLSSKTEEAHSCLS